MRRVPLFCWLSLLQSWSECLSKVIPFTQVGFSGMLRITLPGRWRVLS